MNPIGIIGLGKLGLPLASIFAEKFEVHAVDINKDRINQIINQEKFFEPQLNEYLSRNMKRMKLSTDYSILKECDPVFIIVQTPSLPNGKFDLKYVKSAIEKLHEINPHCLCVISSTINIGDTDKLRKIHSRIAYNPEFIRQGSIIHDFLNPKFVLIGAYEEKDGLKIANIWRTLHDKPIYVVKPVEAEIIKLGLNFSFVLSIAFANVIGEICEAYNADPNTVLEIMYKDRRNYKPGLGAAGPCLTPNVNVQTIQGLKPISEIRVGDYVLTHTGKWRRVTKVYRTPYKGEIIKLKHQGIEIGITPDHLVLGRKIKRPKPILCNGKLRKSSNRTIEPLSWTPIGEIKDDFLFAYPKPYFESNDVTEILKDKQGRDHLKIKITPDFMRLAGYYLAEGWVNKKQERLEMSFNAKETEYIKDAQNIMKKIFHVKLSPHKNACTKTATRLRCSGKVVSRFFYNMLGSGAENKRIPWKWLNTSRIHRIELLKGLFRGDGCFVTKKTKDGFDKRRFTFATVSRELFNQVKLILLDLGIAFSTRVYPEHGFHKESYWIRVSGNYCTMLKKIFGMKHEEFKKGRRLSREIWIQDDYLLTPIRKEKITKEYYDGYVYNLEVEEDNSYCLESIVVHNCFPRDLLCFNQTCNERGLRLGSLLAAAVGTINHLIVDKYVQKIMGYGRKRIGILGVAYKAGVPYIYESQAIEIAKKLLKKKCELYIYDELAEEEARKALTDKHVTFCNTITEVTEKAEVLFIGTPNYKNIKTDKPVVNPWT